MSSPIADMAFRRSPSIVLRPIHGTFFLIDIKDNYASDRCSLYEVNEVGAFLWERLDGERTPGDLVEFLSAAIVDDVPMDVLLQDVREYLQDLMDKQFVIGEM